MLRRRAIIGANGNGLPSELQEVEFLGTNSSGPYIDTGVIPNYPFEIELDFYSYDQYSNVLLGNRPASAFSSGRSVVVQRSNTNNGNYKISIFTKNGQEVTSKNLAAGAWHHLILSADSTNISLTLDGTLFTYKSPSVVSNPLILFSEAPNTSYASPKTRFKRIGIKVQNELVRLYVPCRRITDSIGGMYDLVTKSLYLNAGTGNFVVGSDI